MTVDELIVILGAYPGDADIHVEYIQDRYGNDQDGTAHRVYSRRNSIWPQNKVDVVISVYGEHD